MIDINLHEYRNHLKLKMIDGQKNIWDPIRKRYIILQPEELVRQLMIQCLASKYQYPMSRMQVEKSLSVVATNRRYDIVVYDQNISPFLLIECKSHKESINQKVVDQIGRYNYTMNAPYILVTNGVQTYVCQVDRDTKTTTLLSDIPNYPIAQ